ncbi:MAG: AmmeMemoRadiSam system protein A [Melioribacteraceae bacterium]|nr:AmmeMemoRadiSam system protein A [Melioribacteraceae bacterium]
MELTSAEKKILLKAARSSIKSYLYDTDKPQIDYNEFPKLKENHGAFVTLTINNNLRGCIGYIVANDPVFETVCTAAIQASANDPRFPSLAKTELEKIAIEISILSIPFKMNSYDEIEVGKHGLILKEGYNHGLLLPQVPIEHNMNKDQYLSALCNKAGLYRDYWKEKVLNIEMFTATVFSEKEMEEQNDNS